VPRPTPARLLYLFVGLLLGIVAAIAVQLFLLPSLTASLPFGGQAPPPPLVASGPAQFTAGELLRVAPVNLAREHGGVTLRLNTLELYRDGFTLTYAVLSGRGGVSAPTLEPEAFQASDERGTSYTLTPLASGAVLSAGITTGLASFTPAPPADVRQIRVVVPNVIAVGLRLREGQPRVTTGPWEFVVPLAG
jgi:hypothetical protein